MEAALSCVMTTHSRGDLPRDSRVLRAATDYRPTLGVFASIGYSGCRASAIRSGWPSELLLSAKLLR